MAVHHHTTFGTIKKERDRFVGHSPACTFNSSSSQQHYTNQSSPFPLLTGGEKTLGGFEHKLEDLDMDLAKFLGESETTADTSNIEPSDWNTLFTGTELEGLDFLDPTTGVPTSASNMANSDHPNFVPGSSSLSVVPTTSYNGQVQVEVQQTSSDPNWLFEQSQKLERQQQLQQQKLLELEQTLLRTEILKNRLEIVSNLKHASPELQSQLIGALSNRPAPVGGTTVAVTTPSLATPTTVAPRLVSRPNQISHSTAPLPPPPSQPTTITTSIPSPPDSEFDDFTDYGNVGGIGVGGKKKSHNLIEKKYRTSINDRIGMLRSIVGKHFKDDKKMQKSAVLQKTIDYIRYLENYNRRLVEENQQLKDMMGRQGFSVPMVNGSNGMRYSSTGQNSSPLSWSEVSEEGHPSSPDVFLSDTSPTGSPPLISPSYTTSTLKLGGHIFMCFMLVMCFFVDPLSLMDGTSEMQANSIHGSQRTLSSVDTREDDDMGFTLGWLFMWAVRLFIAGLCFGWVWLHALPVHNPEWEGVRFWRLRKQAEKDIKLGDFSSAQVQLLSALTEIGLPLPTSYSSLVISLVWNGLSHLLFQLYIGQIMVNIVSLLVRGRRVHKSSTDLKTLQSVTYADVAKTKHLLHQISLAGYDERTMHGLGFYLGITALNYGSVERSSFTRDQWAELLFVMGVQCQFSCACVASLLAHYYFLCAGSLGGLLSFVNTPDGWDFLMSKEWISSVQEANKLYRGVAVFPKYSVARSYCKSVLTEAYHDLLLPYKDNSNLYETDLNETIKLLKLVLSISRQANTYLVDDMKLLGNSSPTLTDTVSTRDCGFEILMWWASMGLVSCLWSKEGGEEESHQYYTIIEDLSNKCGSIPSALHLVFKAQRLYRHSSVHSPPVTVINQLCSTASQALSVCSQNLSSEDNLNLLGLFLACDWLLDLRYSVWQNHKEGTNEEEEQDNELIIKHIVKGYSQDVSVLSQLTTLLPKAFPKLSKYKGYQRLMCGGNPILADSFLNMVGDVTTDLKFRQRKVVRSSS